MIKVGDTVRYSRQFLQSICEYTGIANAKGVVTEIKSFGKDMKIAKIAWNDDEVPINVHVANLVTMKQVQMGE